MIFEKRHTEKSIRHTNTNLANNTKIRLQYLIEIGLVKGVEWVKGGQGVVVWGQEGVIGCLGGSEQDCFGFYSHITNLGASPPILKHCAEVEQ